MKIAYYNILASACLIVWCINFFNIIAIPTWAICIALSVYSTAIVKSWHIEQSYKKEIEMLESRLSNQNSYYIGGIEEHWI